MNINKATASFIVSVDLPRSTLNDLIICTRRRFPVSGVLKSSKNLLKTELFKRNGKTPITFTLFLMFRQFRTDAEMNTKHTQAAVWFTSISTLVFNYMPMRKFTYVQY